MLRGSGPVHDDGKDQWRHQGDSFLLLSFQLHGWTSTLRQHPARRRRRRRRRHDSIGPSPLRRSRPKKTEVPLTGGALCPSSRSMPPTVTVCRRGAGGLVTGAGCGCWRRGSAPSPRRSAGSVGRSPPELALLCACCAETKIRETIGFKTLKSYFGLKTHSGRQLQPMAIHTGHKLAFVMNPGIGVCSQRPQTVFHPEFSKANCLWNAWQFVHWIGSQYYFVASVNGLIQFIISSPLLRSSAGSSAVFFRFQVKTQNATTERNGPSSSWPFKQSAREAASRQCWYLWLPDQLQKCTEKLSWNMYLLNSWFSCKLIPLFK